MDGVPIYYVMQPSIDDSLNVFFLPPTYKSTGDVKIKDVVAHFPLKDNGKYFHYRFYAVCDKDQKTWVDISNLAAKAPVVDNRILLKVLELAEPNHSKIFGVNSKGGQESSTSNNPPRQEAREQPQPQLRPKASSQNQQQQQQQQQQQPRPQQQFNSQPQRPNFGSPSHNQAPNQSAQNQMRSPPQKAPQPQQTNTFKSPPPSTSDFEDLLGGDHGNVKATTTNVTYTKTTVTTSASKKDSTTGNMTRAELVEREKQMIDDAINDKVKFAQKVWDEEAKIKQDKEKAYEELEELIKKWAGKNNQRNNIRALLCTVHEVAWQGAGWNSVSLSDLMDPKRIKVNYFKAMTKFHPDKNQDGDYRQKYICERVTNELNAAWDEFRKANPGI